MKILVTGAAGFIGFHVARTLLEQGHDVVGVDNFNDYYDVQLKRRRIAQIAESPQFRLCEIDFAHHAAIRQLFETDRFDRVIHLGAQAGVRYSLQNPHAYIESNVVGFMNILEGCRSQKVPHLVYASSSSVYGSNRTLPFSTDQNVDHPVSLYAATKKSNELMAHSYSHLYGLPTTGLRFFTAYGPWGRPDMALFLFTKAMLNGEPIQVFNHGRMQRDMTYIDDIVTGVLLATERIPEPNPNWDLERDGPSASSAPYRIYNLGNHQPVELLKLIETLESCLGRKAIKEYREMQPGDVMASSADVTPLMNDLGFRPNTSIEYGVEQFVKWYLEYHQIPRHNG